MERVRQHIRRWTLAGFAAAILYGGMVVLISVVQRLITAGGIWFLNNLIHKGCPDCRHVMPPELYPKIVVIPQAGFGIILLAIGLLIGEVAKFQGRHFTAPVSGS
jgi:uncharacterized membrane protein YqgA involved in biofilm formation